MEVREASAEELIRANLTPAPSMVFKLDRHRQEKGTDVIVRYPIRVQLLSVEEDISLLLDAQEFARSRGEVSKDYGDVYKEAQAVELLVRCLRQIESRDLPDGVTYYPALFTTPAQLRGAFNVSEMAQCVNMYEIVKARYGALESFDPADTELWISRLSDPLARYHFLSVLDSQAWSLLILNMATWAKENSSRPLTNWDDTSESDPQSSDEPTGFSTLPPAESSAGDELPTDKLLTAEEARLRVQQMKRRKK